MHIEIESTDLNEFTIDTRTIRQQTGHLFTPNSKYPEKITFTVDRPFPVGIYELDIGASIRVYRGKLQIGRLQLRPKSVPAAKSAG